MKQRKPTAVTAARAGVHISSGIVPNSGSGERNLSGSPDLYISVVGVPTSEDAIERVYRDCGMQLWRGIYAFSGGRADIADDAVAEAFARALERRSGCGKSRGKRQRPLRRSLIVPRIPLRAHLFALWRF